MDRPHLPVLFAWVVRITSRIRYTGGWYGVQGVFRRKPPVEGAVFVLTINATVWLLRGRISADLRTARSNSSSNSQLFFTCSTRKKQTRPIQRKACTIKGPALKCDFFQVIILTRPNWGRQVCKLDKGDGECGNGECVTCVAWGSESNHWTHEEVIFHILELHAFHEKN